MIGNGRLFYLFVLLLAPIVSAKIVGPIQELKNPLCIVDVGGVLVHQPSQLSNIPAYADIIMDSNNKVELIKAGCWCMYNLSKLRTINLQGTEDAVIDYIAEKYPVLNELTKSNKRISDQAKEILCLAEPIKETQKIVSDLSNNGYSIALGSNKGKKTLERMVQAGTLPDLAYAAIGTCDGYDMAHEGIFYKKPDARYFELLKKNLYQKGFVDNSFIFIDKEFANVEAASKAGMTGILYTTPEQLILDLQQLGIKF